MLYSAKKHISLSFSICLLCLHHCVCVCVSEVAPFEFPNQLNSLVVVGIALGIPMILLSLLLLIRLQRYSVGFMEFYSDGGREREMER